VDLQFRDYHRMHFPRRTSNRARMKDVKAA